VSCKIAPRYFVIITLLFISFSTTNSQAQTYTLSGIVREARSGEVVIGTSVMLFKDSVPTQNKAPMRGTVTNKFGFYSIPRLASGTYGVVVRSIGYQTFTATIVLKDSSTRLDIQLENQDIRTQEVVVEAEREASPTSTIGTIEVAPEFIQKLPSLGGETDVFRALQLLPGVKSASEISSGLYVRGGSPDQNLTLLDGVIVYNPSHLGGFLSTFNSDALRDIRLIKGAFPAEYGGRLSSVLDLTMREGSKERIITQGGISLIASRLAVEGPITDDITFMVSGRRMYLDLITALLAPADEETPDYYFYDLNGKINYRISESDQLFVSGYFGRDVFGFEEGDEGDNFGISWGNSAFNTRWSHIISPELFSNFSLIYTDYNFSTDISSSLGSSTASFGTYSRIKDYVARGELQYFPTEDHIIKTGAEVIFHNFTVSVDQNLSEDLDLFVNQNNLYSTEASFYLQDEWKITDQLASNLGARLFYFKNGNYFQVEPRASLAYAVTDDIKLTSSFAVANQFLHLITKNNLTLPTDLWFPSTATIKPARSIQGGLGLETALFEKEYFFSVEGYYKDMRNLYEYKDSVIFAFGIPLESQFTSGRGEAYGVEFFLNKRVGAVTGWLGYTLSWTKRYFAELNNGKMFYPRYDRRHDISAVITYDLNEDWQLGATWVYGTGQGFTMPSGQYAFGDINNGSSSFGDLFFSQNYPQQQYTERNGYRVSAFHKLDLNLTYKFTMFDIPFQFSTNIYNAYNRKNTFAQSVQYDQEIDSEGQLYTKPVVKRFTLFPIIPTFGLSFKF
jgi:outer membrane cobalamin receptor